MKPDSTLLVPELTFKTSRSGGSGGQHVNKVSTKVELDFDVMASKILTEEQKNLIIQKLTHRISADGILQIVSQAERSQLRNKLAALKKFHELIESCFLVQKKRKATTTPWSVKQKRLITKKRNAEIKKLRKKDF